MIISPIASSSGEITTDALKFACKATINTQPQISLVVLNSRLCIEPRLL